MSTSTERRIKALRTRLKSLLTSFNLIKAFVDEYQGERDSSQVSVRLEHLVTLWKDVNATQVELETLDEDGLDKCLKIRSDFETSYFHVKGFLLSVNKSPILSPTSLSQSNAQFPAAASSVRLPDVKLPVFSGHLDSWLNFHDLFVSLVHSSHELSSIQKFYYLRSSLSGDALKLIQTIAISANNYQVAWTLLIDHYQNPARLKQSYVDSLFEFPSLKRESAAELHSLVEKFEANVRVLKQLGERTEFWDLLLIRMLSIRLDPTTMSDWEEYSSSKGNVIFTDLTSFIQRRVTVLQTIHKTTESSFQSGTKKPVPRPVASHGASQPSNRKCLVCSDHHPLYQCAVFSKLSLEDKEKDIRRLQLCRNCLRKGHQARECSSSSTCRKCRNRHHTQLCPGENPVAVNSRTTEHAPPNVTPAPTTSEPPKNSASAVSEPICYASSNTDRKSVLLATAVVILVDDKGTEHPARALLDSGSECCFMTESLAQQIKAKRIKIHVPIAGIGQSSTHARQKLTSTIRSRVSEYSAAVEFLVLPKVTVNLPSTSVDISSWELPPGIQLADPSFCDTKPVQLVLGAEIFFELFKVSGRIQLGESLPNLVNSVLGWVVSGGIANCRPTTSVTANVATIPDLHRLMEKFWSLEEDNQSTNHSVEEAACEAHFCRTVSRSPEGRYVVRLPLKQEVLPTLGDNRRSALRRFHLVENRLSRNPDLGDQYREFMREYEELGHMLRVLDYEQPPIPNYHLPHHAVVREDSTTTKVRVVFDASCRTTEGSSLNDALMVGPIVQEDLRSIIMRSRTKAVMLIADIKQMFRQILVDERDTPLQRIVWRASPDAPMSTYELKTVTYGSVSC